MKEAEAFRAETLCVNVSILHWCSLLSTLTVLFLTKPLPLIVFFKDGNKFGPEVPHVIGYLLEKGRDCLAVIHALPVCRIEGEAFVPRYTMFMVSYFSHHKPEDVRDDVKWFGNRGYIEVPVDIFSEPPDGTDHWWDLKRWVADGLLYWVDGNDPGLGLRTRDPEAFPMVR